ncbi:hypothetical protein DdX_20075 [Ditylenchus destructor]|uniref:Uncharacterized protein n=1 Tax=Ditylenchus destructor TaxID=166010 RepID=A0AAD4QWJ5_9BILA|nr:hypothetical protein DdX_20075 [Ditylenchus destructor]
MIVYLCLLAISLCVVSSAPDTIGAQKKTKVNAKKGTDVKPFFFGKFVEKSYLLENVLAAFPGAKKITVHTQTRYTYVKEDTVVTKETPGIKFFEVDEIQGITVG